MSFYQKLAEIGPRFFSKATILKYAFNLSPMYRRTTARVTYVSDDLLTIKIKIPLNYKNKNYVGSIFGGSMFSAVDPMPMVQLLNILDNQYIAWDKSAEIFFKIPAKESLYAEFTYTETEVEEIKKSVEEKGEIVIIKNTNLVDFENNKIFCEVKKKIYIASKEHYKRKMQARKNIASIKD